MAFIDLERNHIWVKLVYWGPARSGKTTNLLYASEALKKRGARLLTAEVKGKKPLAFELVPVRLGRVGRLEVRVQLLSSPGTPAYYHARSTLLKDVDGIIFVADSLKVRREKNIESLKELEEALLEWGIEINEVPVVFLFNKRDLKEVPILTVEELEEDLSKPLGAKGIEGVALEGIGVFEAIKEVAKQALLSKVSIRYLADITYLEISEIELQIEKGFEELTSFAERPVLKEEEVERLRLLEPAEEDPEELLKEFIVLAMTLERETVIEVSGRLLELYERLKGGLDPLSNEVLDIMEHYIKDIPHPEVFQEKINEFKVLADFLYMHRFERADILEKIEKFRVKFEAVKQEEPPVLQLELEEVPEEPKKEELVLEEKKEEEEDEVFRAKTALFVSHLLRSYQRLVAMEELMKLERKDAVLELFSRQKEDLLKTLEEVAPELLPQLKEKEEEIRRVVSEEVEEREEKEALELDVSEGLLCKTGEKYILIPIDEVAFAGEIEDHWRPYLLKGTFPLRLLKGRGLFSKFFGKVAPKLKGELSHLEEKELVKLEFETNKPLTTESKLVLVWKNGKGLAYLVEDFKLVNLRDVKWEPEEGPFVAKTTLNEGEVYLLSLDLASQIT